MKNYFIRAIIFMVGFMITLLLLDLITGDMQPFREYVEQTVVVGVLVGVGWVLNDKGNEFYNKRYDVIFIAADAEIQIEIHLYLL